MNFHEGAKNFIFGSKTSNSDVTSGLVLAGAIFTVCQFVISLVQPAPYGRYANSSPSYLTCMLSGIYIYLPKYHSISDFVFFKKGFQLMLSWHGLYKKVLHL